MDFDWSPMALTERQALLAQAPRVPLLQSWPYARAMRIQNQIMSRTARIRQGNDLLGLFQIQDVALGPFHIVQLHGGPVWFDPDTPLSDWQAFVECFDAAFPRRIGRMRRLMPDLPDTQETRDLMSACGFRPKSDPYETVWVSLKPDLPALRMGLNQKWRNGLNKAERSGLTIDFDPEAEQMAWFLKGYRRDKGAKAYRGASPAFLRSLTHEAALLGDCWILRALYDRRPIAGILILLHGASATYQAGWNTGEGRKRNAHHLLLWNAMARLRNRGIVNFDLGGIHPKMAEGVTRFKQGLGGEHCVLAGLYA